eukprot:366018-Chlamydomonas_euryale.AAC.15
MLRDEPRQGRNAPRRFPSSRHLAHLRRGRGQHQHHRPHPPVPAFLSELIRARGSPIAAVATARWRGSSCVSFVPRFVRAQLTAVSAVYRDPETGAQSRRATSVLSLRAAATARCAPPHASAWERPAMPSPAPLAGGTPSPGEFSLVHPADTPAALAVGVTPQHHYTSPTSLTASSSTTLGFCKRT